MDVAILLLLWRRPIHTKKLINAIGKVNPNKIYISCDGPIKNDIKNEKLVKLTRDIVLKEINWDCQIKTNFLDINKGCKVAVSDGINWFFKNEEEGIILEDDCLPNKTFFLFCQSLLEKYRNDQRIWAICGNGYQFNNTKEESYFYSRYVDVWGWATWRRCWEKYDGDIKSWEHNKDLSFMKNIFEDQRELNYWKRIFNNLFYNNIPDTWDYQWQYLCFINSGMICMPYINLVKNIGFGEGATHTTEEYLSPNFDLNKQEELKFPLKHPSLFIRSKKCDQHLQNIFYSGYPIFSFKGSIILFQKVLFKVRKFFTQLLRLISHFKANFKNEI